MNNLRARFTKGEEVKYLSHLDLLRAIERGIRRARLPIALTEGFHPRPKLSFASALAVGITSDGEYMDMEFSRPVEPEQAKEGLNAVLPTGLRVLQVAHIPSKAPALMAVVNVASYDLTLACSNGEETADRVEQLMAAEELMVERTTRKRTRQVNIRPLIYRLAVTEANPVQLELVCATGSEGNLRPAEVGGLIAGADAIVSVHRRELMIRQGVKLLNPMEVVSKDEPQDCNILPD